MISKIEKYIMYRAVIDLITREEAYDKKRKTLDGEELFKLCHKRYQMAQELLLPLKEKLGEEMEVTNIAFAQGLKYDTWMIIEYLKNNVKSYLTLSYSTIDNIEMLFSVDNEDAKKVVSQNKDLIIRTFAEGYSRSYDEDLHFTTTSKRFLITDDIETFSMKDSLDGQAINLNTNHSDYEKNKSLSILKNRISQYKNISKILSDDEKLVDTLRNVRVYEDELPKALIKK